MDAGEIPEALITQAR